MAMDWKGILLISLTVSWASTANVVSPADYIILLDSSDSARSKQFGIEERFAVQLATSIYNEENRIGLFTFGEHTHNQFHLNTYDNLQEITQAIRYMWYSTGDGSVASAINFTLTNGFTKSSGEREGIPNILVVLSHSDIKNPNTAAQLNKALSDKNIRTFVIYMNATPSSNFVILTNDTTRVITINGFQALEQSVVSSLLPKINSGYGQLTQWQPWSKCSASCGRGLKFRLRQCHKDHSTDTDCVGELSEDSTCTAAACTDPVDGRWANWNSWSVCTKTCNTGVQNRTRECAAPLPLHGGKPCPGKNREQRNCSEWECPDCGKRCPAGGHLSKDCQVCECSSASLFGQITDENKLPIENAEVFLKSRRYKAIAKSDEMGEFNVSGICLMNEKIYTFASLHASKMQTPSQLNATHWTINGTMDTYIPAVFTVQPHDKSRMVGQSFSLCCSAVGKPAPVQYTWLKDGIVLDNVGMTGTLTISSATKANTGTYKCSTETLAGVSQSDEAHVTITDFADDTCGAPVSKLDHLPDGCFLSGDKTKNASLDVGACGGRRCMTSSLKDNGTCTDWWPHYCCDSKEVEVLDIQCDGFIYKTTRVKSCKCALCIYRTTISGRAFGRNGSDDVPLQLGVIFVGGKQMARTNMAGFFKFEVPKGLKRVVATFHDSYFKKFTDITKIITVTDGDDVYATIVIPLKPNPIPFNASHPKEIALGGGNNGLPPAASLSIQKHSLLTEDGQVYRGAAKASVHFMDPRDRDSLDAANGDFVSETPDGEKSPLKTYGMFQLGVTDTGGKPLQIHKSIEFSLDASLFNVSLDQNGDPDLALWDYDDNKGIWVENTKLKFAPSSGTRRKLLQSTTRLVATLKPNNIPDIEAYNIVDQTKKVWTGRYTNCDHSVKLYETVTTHSVNLKEGVCFVSVSLYSDMSLIEPFSKGSVTITAYTQELDGSAYLGKESRTISSGHACLMIFCDKIVYLTATSSGGEELIPAKHNILPFYPVRPTVGNEVKFESRNFGNAYDCQTPPCTGPVFPFSNKVACEAADKDKSFRFNFAFFTKPPVMTYAVGSENIYDKKLSWYPVSPDKATFRSCFFKVSLKIYETYDIRIFAISYLRNFGGDQFGTHIVGPTPKPNTRDFTVRGACIEFRCPGYVKDGSKDVFDASTAVELHLRTSNKSMRCKLKVQSSQLKPDITPITGSNGVTGLQFMSKAGVNYGSSFGIFINDAHKNDVEKFCKSGSDTGPNISGTMDPVKNPAVEFDCLS